MANRKLPQEWTVHSDHAVMYIPRKTGERVKYIASPIDVSWLSLLRWRIGGNGRATTERLTGKPVLMHRLVMNVRGSEIIDHANRDFRDNRRENLRVCTNNQNNYNRGIVRGAVPFKGVAITMSKKNPYDARIILNDVRVHLGLFPTPELAAAAYDKAADEHYGEFALTNKKMGLL